MIKLVGVTKSFDTNVVLENFYLEIQDGEMIAIVGKSGCGKTTLLNLLGLIDSKYDGEILYDDKNVGMMKKSQKQRFIRNHINYLFQNYALIDDASVNENLELALYYEKISAKEKQQRIKQALAKVGLHGYGTKKIYTLSGGEQQRIALARVILKRGNTILADEPTGNLDEENRNIVLQNLLEQNKLGKTVIIVTHDPYVASRCDRMIEL